jgi:hypothetical protein
MKHHGKSSIDVFDKDFPYFPMENVRLYKISHIFSHFLRDFPSVGLPEGSPETLNLSSLGSRTRRKILLGLR